MLQSSQNTVEYISLSICLLPSEPRSSNRKTTCWFHPIHHPNLYNRKWKSYADCVESGSRNSIIVFLFMSNDVFKIIIKWLFLKYMQRSEMIISIQNAVVKELYKNLILPFLRVFTPFHYFLYSYRFRVTSNAFTIHIHICTRLW